MDMREMGHKVCRSKSKDEQGEEMFEKSEVVND